MPWKTKLKTVFGREDVADLNGAFASEDEDERIQSILVQNRTVAEDLEAATFILQNGSLATFKAGESLGLQDEKTDDVYFLLSGAVDILRDGNKVTIRAAPDQVGEMAAKKPHVGRSATMKARKGGAAAWKVPGHAFRQLLDKNPAFANRLSLEMQARHEERLRASQASQENAWTWVVISALVAFLAATCAWFFVSETDFPDGIKTGGVFVSGLLGFLTALRLNPAYYWHRLTTCFALLFVGKTLIDTAFEAAATSELGSIGLVWRGGLEIPSWLSLALSLLLFALTVLFACFARNREKQSG